MLSGVTAEQIKTLLHLQPHPIEGGFFRRTYTAAGSVELTARIAAPSGTAIYYLLEPGTFSEMHVLDSDEIFHFYLGDPVEMLQLLPDGRSALFTLGSGSGGGSARAAGCPSRRLARHTPRRRRQGCAAGLHRHARLRLRRLPQRQRRRTRREVAAGSRKNPGSHPQLSGLPDQ